MALALDIVSWLCLIAGGLLGVTAGVGLVRLPDLFTRMHAADRIFDVVVVDIDRSTVPGIDPAAVLQT